MSKYTTIPLGVSMEIGSIYDNRFTKGGMHDVSEKVWVFDNPENKPDCEYANGLITSDWFGVSTHVEYHNKADSILMYRNWEDFCSLNIADSRLWVKYYKNIHGLFRIRHLLHLPRNITENIELKDLNVETRKALSTALVSKELAYHFDKAGTPKYSHVILNDAWTSTLKFEELARSGEVSKYSPRYLRELIGYEPMRTEVIQCGYQLDKNKIRAIDWDDVQTSLSASGLSVTITTRHPFLGTHIIVDNPNSKKSVGVLNLKNKGISSSPTKLFNGLPELDVLLEQCALVSSWAESAPVDTDLIEAEDYAQATLDKHVNSRLNYLSTNPICMGIINKLWDSNRLYNLDTIVSAPKHFKFIAELMEKGVLRFEAIIQYRHDNEYLLNPLRIAGKANDKDAKTRLGLRIAPEVENFIILTHMVLVNDLKEYSSAIKIKIREYLQTDENIEIALRAVDGYVKISQSIGDASSLLSSYTDYMLDSDIIEQVVPVLQEVKNGIQPFDPNYSALQLLGGINIVALKETPDF